MELRISMQLQYYKIQRYILSDNTATYTINVHYIPMKIFVATSWVSTNQGHYYTVFEIL